jgi:hypothetical protein
MDTKLKTDTFQANLEDIVDELKTLFYFSPPEKIRKHILESFFTYLIELDDYPNHHREIVEDHYFLVMFFNRMDEINERRNLNQGTGRNEQV